MLFRSNPFWTLLEWVGERPELREKLVKTGWKSWKNKWREKAFEKSKKEGSAT